jgi:hypothetical protein
MQSGKERLNKRPRRGYFILCKAEKSDLGKEWTMNRKASKRRCFVAVEKSKLGKETLNLFDTWKLSMAKEESWKRMIGCYAGRGTCVQQPPKARDNPMQSCA